MTSLWQISPEVVKSQVMAQNWPVVKRDNEYTAIQRALVDQKACARHRADRRCGRGQNYPRAPGHAVAAVAGAVGGRYRIGAQHPARRLRAPGRDATSRDPVAFLSAARETIIAEGHSVIGVDDAHLLDELSATLLHQLALDGSVRIVATVRSGETVPDAITSLWKDGYLQRLHLTPFSKDQCIRLIEEALGGRVEGLSADLMWEASGGNALFVKHLVEGRWRPARCVRCEACGSCAAGRPLRPNSRPCWTPASISCPTTCCTRCGCSPSANRSTWTP